MRIKCLTGPNLFIAAQDKGLKVREQTIYSLSLCLGPCATEYDFGCRKILTGHHCHTLQ
jgi:hypothetical protein